MGSHELGHHIGVDHISHSHSSASMTLRQLKLNAPDGTARAHEKRDPVARALTQDDSRMVLAPAC